MKLRALLVGIAVIGGVALAFSYPRSSASHAGVSPGAGERPPVPVRVASAERGELPLEITAIGHVTPINHVEVRAQVSGVVARVLVREGQTVRAGQALFALEDAAEQAVVGKASAQLSRDRAQLAVAERNLARTRDLLGRGFVSASALDAAQAGVDAARGAVEVAAASVRETEAQSAYRQLRSAIAGRVGAVNVSPGSLVQPNAAVPLTTITQLAPTAVSFSVPERYLGAIRAAAGEHVPVKASLADSPQQVFPGRLVFIDNTVNSASGQILMKAEFANETLALWPGNYVKLTVHAGLRQGAVSIPIGGLVTGPDGKFVYVVDAERKTLRQPVEVLDLLGERAIVGGLAGGETVVVEGSANLRAGDRLRLPEAAVGEAPRRQRVVP